MLWFLLASMLAAPVSILAEFVCGFDGASGEESRAAGGSSSTPIDYKEGDFKLFLVFGKFPVDGEKSGVEYNLSDTPREIPVTGTSTMRSASDLFDAALDGSFTHYMKKMSGNDLTILGPPDSFLESWHPSTGSTFADFNNGSSGDCSNITLPLTKFATEVLGNIITPDPDSPDKIIPSYEDYHAFAVVIPNTFRKKKWVYPGFSTPKRKYGKYLSPCCSSEYMTRP